VGFLLPPYQKTTKRKAISRAKFFLFDIGVSNSLCQVTSLSPSTVRYGLCFEHFIILELRAYLSYKRRQENLTFWKSQSGFEVDIVVGNKLAIEIKSADLIQARHLRGLKALREEGQIERFAVISRDLHHRLVDGIDIYPWAEFLTKLWNDEIINT